MTSALTPMLIKILEGENVKLESSIIDSLIDLAAKNKVLLELLRTLDICGPLRGAQEETLRRKVETVRTISEILKGFDFAFFKLTKPIRYVPADIDILTKSEEARKIVKKIAKIGYVITVKEPYCFELVRGSSAIDLYTYPTVGAVAYLNGQALLEHIRQVEFEGLEIISLESYAEALVAAAHAVYKEKIYTLNDLFIVKKWSSRRSFRLAEELNCEQAVRFAQILNQEIEKGILNTPYSIPAVSWFTLLLQKFYNDKLTRETSINILQTLCKRRTGKLIVSKFTRTTY